MPIENERKFVLNEDGLEAELAADSAVTRSFLRQAYLDVSGMRIRSAQTGAAEVRHLFTYKRPIDGQVVEIETEISAVDFERLWSQRRETLQKLRYSWTDGPFHWDVDFFKADGDHTYFIQAEVEMPEGQVEPPPLPPGLADHLLGMAPAGDPRFASKRLASQAHAEQILADIKSKGRIE